MYYEFYCNHANNDMTLSRALAETWAASGAPVFHHRKDGTAVPVPAPSSSPA